MDWTKFIELGIVGMGLLMVLWYVFSKHIPKIMEAQEKRDTMYKESLDLITQRNSDSTEKLADAITNLSREITVLRESTLACRLKQEA